MARFATFGIGFATGALTVLAFQRLREIEKGQSVEHLAESLQDNLAELEARIESVVSHEVTSGKRATSSRRKG